MGNWEWRVFCRATDSVPSELWSLLGLTPPSREPERTDVYLTCTAGAGLKLRNQRELEIKLRKDINSDDGAENWKKVVSTSLPHGIDPQNPAEVAHAFERELLRYQPRLGYQVDKPGMKESLEEALVALSKPQQLVSVTKSRYKKHAFALHVDSIEETCVSVSVGSEAVTTWRTVCIEASKADSISKTLSMKVKCATREVSLKEYLLSGSLEAYPQYVLNRTSD